MLVVSFAGGLFGDSVMADGGLLFGKDHVLGQAGGV